MKVSKVVLVVVALHVLVIGGIFVFEGCSRAKVPSLAENDSLPMATGDVATTLPMPVPVPAPVSDSHLTSATPLPVPAPTTVTAVPAPAPVATATATYAVKKGDSLYKIAKSNKITIEQLARANNLSKSGVLQIGQKLTIPAPAAAAPAPATTLASAPVAAQSSSGGNAYEVQLGDSLWKIAKVQGTTIAALKAANNLTSDSLKVGQKLTIPAKVAPATTVSAPVTTPAGATTAPATTTPAVSGPAVIAPGISVR